MTKTQRSLIILACIAGLAYATAPPRPHASSTPPGEEPKRVYLIHADELRYDRNSSRNAQVLTGQVHFEHDGAHLYCDSANFFEDTNSFEAFGHVKMVQGDTLSLTSERGYYDGQQLMMEAHDNVVLRHRKTTLHTDELYYDRIWQVGYFQQNGKLVDGNTTLVSDWGEYHTDNKTAMFYYSVTMLDGKMVLTTDSLYYDTQLKRAHIVGPSNITSGKSRIYSEMGYYYSTTEVAELMNRSRLFNEGKTLIADSLWHNDKTGVSEAFGNVDYNDTVNHTILRCDYGHYEEQKGYAVCTDNALAIDYSQKDSLYVHGDTIKVFSFNIDTDSVYREMHTYNKVRAYRVDLQAVCDSLVYTSRDSCLTLFNDPVVWNLEQQLVGDSIKVFMRDSVVDHAHVVGNAFSIEKLPKEKCYNQISSKEMFAFFNEGKMREAQAKDNVIAVYYPEDKADSSYVGLVYLETEELRMFLNEEQKLDKIWAPKSEGTMYPMSQIPPAKRELDGFAWYDYIRPVDKDDIFNWRPKRKASADDDYDGSQPPPQAEPQAEPQTAQPSP